MTVFIKERPVGMRFRHEDDGKKLVVHSVTPGKFAERSGICPGDVISRINSDIIRDSNQALKHFRTCTLPIELCLLTTQETVTHIFVHFKALVKNVESSFLIYFSTYLKATIVENCNMHSDLLIKISRHLGKSDACVPPGSELVPTICVCTRKLCPKILINLYMLL